jgi:hypothetical protein
MNEGIIRGWFSQFGTLKEIIVDSSWGKAILVYADYESAAKAWNDPRPVFDNRFVKIWWKKTDAMELSGGIVDQVELEVAREAAKKAQREHEEKQRRKEELERKKEELERQRVELVERQRVEREKLMEKIRRAEEKGKGKQGPQETATRQAVAQGQVQPAHGQENGVVTSASEASAQPANASVPPTNVSTDETSRKAHLEKMLSDLKSQVPPLPP